MHEQAYAAAAKRLKLLGVPFARANADNFRSELKALNSHDLPLLVAYRKGKRPVPYQWMHTPELIASFASKLLAPAVAPLLSVAAVLAFVDPPLEGGGDRRPPGSSAVVGFFSDPHGMEEDEYAEFAEAVAPLQERGDVFVGAVSDPLVVAAFKGAKAAKAGREWVDRSPAVVVQRLGRRK